MSLRSIMTRFAGLVTGGLLMTNIASTANAALINAPVPTNAFITIGNLDWAWANPLPGADLSFQGAFGWRFPTLTDLSLAPLATDFIFLGANVPLGGIDPVSDARFQATNPALIGDAACAAPYFTPGSFRHCDWQDGLGQPFGPWAGLPGAFSFADQLVVRNAVGNPIPEPAALGLLGLGLMGISLARLKKKTA